MSTERLRAVVYQDAGAWIAQGIDLDIGAQAETRREAIARFRLTANLECAECEVRGQSAVDVIGPAPKQFHDMWAMGEDLGYPNIIREYAI